MTQNEIIAIIASIISITGSLIYLRSVLQGKTKPHLYTHLVWGILTAVAFFAQLSDNGGPGAWVMAITSVFIFIQVGLCFKYGEKDIHVTDKIALAACLIAIIPWLLADNILLSVLLVTAIDVVAYYPTLRKTWVKPFEENMTGYGLGSLKFALSIWALDNISMITAFYPAALIAANTVLMTMCLWRRQSVKQKSS